MKKATIQTPDFVSKFIFQTVSKALPRDGVVFDPSVGEGSLLKPFKEAGYRVIGVDIEDQGFPETRKINYLEMESGEVEDPSLVIMNPPFNIDEKTEALIKKLYPGRPLLPEIWLRKTIETFGISVPIIMFTPYGFRLNQTRTSKRWRAFMEERYPSITSIISLPKDTFEGILFHSEILCFNIEGLNAHYFCV